MDRLYVTNSRALTAKYPTQFGRIWAAITSLVGPDARLEDVTAPVDDVKGNKDCVDTLYQRYHPDSLILIGAQDVIPFITLKASGPYIFVFPYGTISGDLAYATNGGNVTPKGTDKGVDPKPFLHPQRVVSRIPDLYMRPGPAGNRMRRVVPADISLLDQPGAAWHGADRAGGVVCLFGRQEQTIECDPFAGVPRHACAGK